MRPEELLRILPQKPFRPLRICTTDGAGFEILHPLWIPRWRYLQLPADPQSRVLEHFSVARDGDSPPSDWVFPDGVVATLSYEPASVLSHVPEQIPALHAAG